MEIIDGADVIIFPTEVHEVKVAARHDCSPIFTEVSLQTETNPNYQTETHHSDAEEGQIYISPRQAPHTAPAYLGDPQSNPSLGQLNLISQTKMRQKAITKPTTMSSKKRSSALGQTKAQKCIPEVILKNPIISKKFNIYHYVDKIVAKPPRAALDSKSYNPRDPVELSVLALSVFDGNNIKNFENATEEEIKMASNQLKQYEMELIDQASYMDAKKAAKASDKLDKFYQKQKALQKLKENLESLLSKRNELIFYINSLSNEIQRQLEENNEGKEQKMKEIEFIQTEEIRNFDESVPNELTKEFRHETSEYLELRVKQRSLAMKRDFEGAQKLKEKADKVQKSQIKGDIKKMRKYYKRKRNKILKRHRLQLQVMLDGFILKEKEIKQSRKTEIEATEARIEAINSELKIKCEEKGIKMSDLNLENVDERRVEMLISRSNETRYAKLRSRSAANKLPLLTANQNNPPL